MKTVILNIIISLAVFYHGFAQVTRHVEPGEGTLESAISAASPNDILELNGGGIYTVSTASSGFGQIKFPLTIRVKDGSAGKAILCLGNNASTSRKYYFFEINDGAALTLEGLDIHGLLNDSVIAYSLLIFDARPTPSESRIGNFKFSDCNFHDFEGPIVHGMKDDYARGLIQDSVFIDRVTVYNATHFLQYKHVSLHHLEMTNSTVYNMNGIALKVGKIGYRCVLETPNKPYIPVTDETITPTGFIDHCTLDNLGDIHGHIQVDNAFHALTFSNCIFSHQQQFDQPAIFLFEPMCDTAGIIKNTCFWDVAPPNADVGFTSWIAYLFQDTMTFNPSFRDATKGNFSLPSGSPLLTAGAGGSQLGDTRWGTYEPAATGGLPVWAGQRTGLAQNYPNPFRKTTEISFYLSLPGYVSIKIYNVLGAEIDNPASGEFSGGSHRFSWDAGLNKPGIYFCRLQNGSYVKTIRMILE